MATILTEIEASMNSRPLVPMTEDPNDLACLTPAHFLIGANLHALPETNVRDIPLGKLDHYQRLQRFSQDFWHHWRTEYLQELQRDTKICDQNVTFRPGQLVVIVEDFQIPVKWPLARIIALHPGRDNLCRVVSLKTAKGIIRRPITKICLLPTENHNRSEDAAVLVHDKSLQSDDLTAEEQSTTGNLRDQQETEL